MTFVNSRASRSGKFTIVVSLAILMAFPAAEAAIARSSVDFQQLYQREVPDRSYLSEKPSQPVEVYKPQVPSLIIEDTQDTTIPEVERQFIPDPLPPVFEEELALSTPRRLDVLKEAGAELPWPIGMYNAHVRGVSIAGSLELPHIDRRQHLPISEAPDKRHRYMHSILYGYGNEENVAGAFGI